jgi:hypothetical protein
MRFLTFLWHGHGFWKRTAVYSSRHVVTLASMLARHGGHTLACATDRPDLMPGHVAAIALPPAVSGLPDYGPKLWAFSPELHAAMGERFAVIDLDVVLAGDPAVALAPFKAEPVAIWNKAAGEPYNSSLFVIAPGACNAVWERASPAAIAAAKAAAGRWTGDQSWIAHVLGPGRPTFGEETGIMQYRPKLHRDTKPAGLIAGFMCGPYEPFDEATRSPWVKAYYR